MRARLGRVFLSIADDRGLVTAHGLALPLTSFRGACPSFFTPLTRRTAAAKSLLRRPSVSDRDRVQLNATRINDTKIHYQGFILAFWFTSRYERE
jgi:hypothetical protein